MKKYMLFAVVMITLCTVSSAWSADFGDLLSRLDSRDFTAEKDVALPEVGPYVGETSNPLEDTVMFVARNELLDLILDAASSPEKMSEVNAFLVDAVGQDISIEIKSWLLRQFAMTATAEQVPTLEGFLTSTEPALVDAAAAALSKTACPEAEEALNRHGELPAVQAALIDRHTPVPALNPNESEMPLALSNASDEEFDSWMKNYASLDEVGKIQALNVVAVRRASSCRDLALAALDSDSEPLWQAGYLALEKIGTRDDLAVLLAGLDRNHDLAMRVCGFIAADGFDDALLDQFRRDTNAPDRVLDLATLLINRGVDIRTDLFARTTAAECPNRLALMEQARRLATRDDISQLVASTVLVPRGKDHDAAENLVAACCGQDATPLVAIMDKYPPAVLFPLLCRTGGDVAREQMNKALDSQDPAVLSAALLALPIWADATFADRMLSFVESGKYPEGLTCSLLRGYIRVVSLPVDKTGIEMTKDEKLAKLKKAFSLAKRLDEKKLILSRLAANRTVNSLEFAMECAADPELAEEAYSAMVEHAHDTGLRDVYPEQVGKALDLIIGQSHNEELVKRAKIYKGRMQGDNP